MDGFGQPYPDITPRSRKIKKHLLEEELKSYRSSMSRAEQIQVLCNMIYVVAAAMLSEGVSVKMREYVPKAEFNREIPMSLHHQLFSDLFLFWQRTANLPQTDQHKNVSSTLLRSAMIMLLETGTNNFYNLQEAFLATHGGNVRKVWTPDEAAAEPDIKFHTLNGQKVAFTEFGKIIKPPSWAAPKYHSFIDAPVGSYKEVLPGVPKVTIRQT